MLRFLHTEEYARQDNALLFGQVHASPLRLEYIIDFLDSCVCKLLAKQSAASMNISSLVISLIGSSPVLDPAATRIASSRRHHFKRSRGLIGRPTEVRLLEANNGFLR